MTPFSTSLSRINLCSGQRPFGTPAQPWVNIDVNPKWNPDLLADGSSLPLPDASASIIVIHHGLEHFGLGEADTMLQECHRILVPGGSLIVTVPDLAALARRWLAGGIDDYTYCVNLYGAYMDSDADRHRWGFHTSSLKRHLVLRGPWREIKSFDFRQIPGADIAKDWWILGVEAVK